MKILMIAPEPFFEPRGTPISIYQRLHALSALGYQVDLLTYHVGQDVGIPGVTVHRGLNVPFIKRVKVGPSWAKAFLDSLLFCLSIMMLVKNRYDVIHSHEEAAYWSVILSKVFHTRHIYDMHSSLPQQLASNPHWNLWLLVKLFEILERWVINTCDAVISIGADLEERVKSINPVAKSALIQNLAANIDDDGSRLTLAQELSKKIGLDGKLAVVYTGNLEHYQGLDLLLKSALLVTRQNPDVSFIIVGGNHEQVQYWQKKANCYGLMDSVIFTGIVPAAEATAYLEVAEILVSPRINGMSVPLKIYNYLQSGKPIVATNLPVHTQILNVNVAILVEPTEDSFAEGIMTLIRSPDLRRKLGLQGQLHAMEFFNPTIYLKKLDQIYQELTPEILISEEKVHLPEDGETHTSQWQLPRLP